MILADQFEESFTLCTDGGLRRTLIENLLHAASVVGGPTLVLLTMRVDFLDKCAAYPDLAAAMSDGQELAGPMTKTQLRLAIEHPAALVGCTLEPGLTDLLMQDVQGQAGALPLLEYTLLELWHQHRATLTIADYHEDGRGRGARASGQRHSRRVSVPPRGARDLPPHLPAAHPARRGDGGHQTPRLVRRADRLRG